MNEKSKTKPDAAELRRVAEGSLAENKKDKERRPNSTEAADLQRLHHELEVHQIELEMQNDELHRANEEAQGALAKYTDLYDFSPTGYFTLAPDGSILEANLTGATMVGIERARLLHRRFGALIAQPDRDAFEAFLKRIFSGDAVEFCEVTVPGERSFPLVVRVEGVLSKDGSECRAALLDVTERHQAALERDGLISQLQQALAQVKLLSGMVPICAECKKIRDAGGQWAPVESYITDHSDAVLTHSLCPDCIAKSFPEHSRNPAG